MREEFLTDGYAIQGDINSEETILRVKELIGDNVPLIVADPPYGNIVSEYWDYADDADKFCSWMLKWTKEWGELICKNGAFYIWGGIGKPEFRPFIKFASKIEDEKTFSIANWITWNKKRAYGVKHNYLFTREELLYLSKGDPKKPHIFNIPLLDQKRGYAGYNEKYPAKSEFLRRTNVWNETEIFRGKLHECQKPDKVSEIPIQTHTNPGDTVIDLFAGSASTSAAARRLGRKWIAIELDEKEFQKILERMA